MFCTEAKLNGDGEADKNGDAIDFTVTKSAVTTWAALMLTVQVVDVPLHAPVHPLNPKPLSGTAVSVTDVP